MRIEGAYYRSNSSEKPLAGGGVKNSQIMIMIIDD